MCEDQWILHDVDITVNITVFTRKGLSLSAIISACGKIQITLHYFEQTRLESEAL